MHRKLANQSGALWMTGFLVQPDYRDRLPASDCPGMVPSLSIIVDQREASAHFGCGQKLTSLLERRLDRGGVFLADGKHGWEHERAPPGRQARLPGLAVTVLTGPWAGHRVQMHSTG